MTETTLELYYLSVLAGVLPSLPLRLNTGGGIEMREIKFRQAIFHPVTGEFLKWHYWGLIDGAFVGIDTGWVSPTKAVENSQGFTTLSDKKGKEIYEEDIVKTTGGHTGVVFDRLGCWFVEMGRELGYYNEPVEIVGNIYENKELLK